MPVGKSGQEQEAGVGTRFLHQDWLMDLLSQDRMHHICRNLDEGRVELWLDAVVLEYCWGCDRIGAKALGMGIALGGAS